MVIVPGAATGLPGRLSPGPRHFASDEPTSVGGTDTGPTPAGLCTVRLRHSRVHAEDCAACETRPGHTHAHSTRHRARRRPGRRTTGAAVGDRQSLPSPSDAHDPNAYHDEAGIRNFTFQILVTGGTGGIGSELLRKDRIPSHTLSRRHGGVAAQRHCGSPRRGCDTRREGLGFRRIRPLKCPYRAMALPGRESTVSVGDRLSGRPLPHKRTAGATASDRSSDISDSKPHRTPTDTCRRKKDSETTSRVRPALPLGRIHRLPHIDEGLLAHGQGPFLRAVQIRDQRDDRGKSDGDDNDGERPDRAHQPCVIAHGGQ